MSDLKIITNRVPRHTLDWQDLTAKEQSAFDYLDTDEMRASAIFVRYKGHVYDLGEFQRPGVIGNRKTGPFTAWEGTSNGK